MDQLFLLSGILIIGIGFAVGLNPLFVVAVAAFATGMAGGMHLTAVVASLGKAFVDSRYIAIIWLVLPVIGVLERAGLRERAHTLIGGIASATAGRILLLYLVLRQITAALGLLTLGGHAQMVRPLIAPMTEAAAESRLGVLPERLTYMVRAYAASTDNVGAFFGEDIFIAVGSILLIKAVMQQAGYMVEPLQLAMWAIPTAVLAFFIHGTRLLLLDRKLKRELARETQESKP
jgi:uncharacterized membrane protein